LKRYISGLKQYYWIPLACIVIAVLAGGIQTILHKPAYHVSAAMIVKAEAPGNSFSPSLTAYDSLGVAANYASEITSRSVMNFVYTMYPQIKERGYTTNDLLADISTSTSATASTIAITAKAANPNDAVLLANSVANGFQAYLQAQLQQQVDATRAGLNSQINVYMQDKLRLQKQIAAINNNSDPRVALYQTSLQTDTQNINQLQSQLVQLPAVVTPNVAVIQLAVDKDATPESNLILPATAAVGLLVGIAIMLLIIFLDNRVYSEEEIKGKLGFAYLGALPETRTGLAQTISSIKHECMDICTNLRFTGVLADQQRSSHGLVLLVTSAQSTEGKTCVAAALATTLAHRGSSVVVVDGNLRQPATHLAFGMNKASVGLGSLLASTKGETVEDVVQRSTVPGVWLLPVGAPIDDSSFVLEQKLPTILSQLRKKTDWIIIDGSSLLSSADASLMASMVDGVVLVVDSKHSKFSLLLRAKEILTSLTHKPVGVILNRFPVHRHNSYYVATTYSAHTSASSVAPAMSESPASADVPVSLDTPVEEWIPATTEKGYKQASDVEDTDPSLKAITSTKKP
jgi:capsular exopolysaccharide synthesis family protein